MTGGAERSDSGARLHGEDKTVDFNWYLDPIRNHYVDFEGVAGRKPFWMFVLYNFVISLVLEVILRALRLDFLVGVYSMAILLPALGLAVRRLHDSGRSGWWLLVWFIPIVGWLILIYFYCQPSTAPYGTAAAA